MVDYLKFSKKNVFFVKTLIQYIAFMQNKG